MSKKGPLEGLTVLALEVDDTRRVVARVASLEDCIGYDACTQGIVLFEVGASYALIDNVVQ